MLLLNHYFKEPILQTIKAKSYWVYLLRGFISIYLMQMESSFAVLVPHISSSYLFSHLSLRKREDIEAKTTISKISEYHIKKITNIENIMI